MTQTRLASIAGILICLAASPALAQQTTTSPIREEVVRLKAEDGGGLYAAFTVPANRQPTIGFLFMHPRGGEVTHFALKPLAERGFATLGMGSRYMNRTGIHEELLLDLAAGVKFLHAHGVQRVILVGHSGGGSLTTFYQSQAEAAPGTRVKHTPAGDPPDLNTFDLPKADGIVTLNAAEGEGLHFTHHLDPSLTDESDPFSYDPSLDPYNPANGFRVPPGVTKYSPEFIDRFYKAQQARGRRLVEIAMGKVREQNAYRDLMQSPAFKQMTEEQQLMVTRRAQFDAPMVIYRTRAELHYYDLSIDPSDREVGHMTADRVNGFRRSDLTDWNIEDTLSTGITARQFLSTLSLVSDANLYENLKHVSVPVFVVNSTADSGIMLGEGQRTYDAAVSKDKEKLVIVGGEHGFEPNGPKAGKGEQKDQLYAAMTAWVNKRWGAKAN